MNAPQVFLKRCSCGKVYNREHWEALALVGQPRMDWGEVQELRNCSCGSTIAIVLEQGEQQDPVVGAIWQHKANKVPSRVKVTAVEPKGVSYRHYGGVRGFMTFAEFYKTFTPVRKTS
jgi:hypothetical protein